MVDPRVSRFRSMLDGRKVNDLCPEDGNTWTRLGAYCTGLLDQVAAGQQLHPIPGHLRPSIAQRAPLRLAPRQPSVSKGPRMKPIAISVEDALDLLRNPSQPIAFEAVGPGVLITLTAVLQGSPTPARAEPPNVPTEPRKPVANGRSFECAECEVKFPSAQGLGAHRRHTHPKHSVTASSVSPKNGAEQTPPPVESAEHVSDQPHEVRS